LLELYGALLEDMNIIAIAEQDYRAFESYCRDNQIEVYEEYHESIRAHSHRYIKDDAARIPVAARAIDTAILLARALASAERYHDVDTALEVVGANLKEDILTLQQAASRIRDDDSELAEAFAATMQKVQRLRKEIVKPAIAVYRRYMQDPEAFLHSLPKHQAEWIPIVDSALACLEPDDDLYRKCADLKQRIDQAIALFDDPHP